MDPSPEPAGDLVIRRIYGLNWAILLSFDSLDLVSGEVAKLSLFSLHSVVLQAGMCTLWHPAAGCGWRMGGLVVVGRMQPNMRRRGLLIHPSLRQPTVSERPVRLGMCSVMPAG